MSLLFFSYERGNLFAVFEEIAKPVKNLSLGKIQRFGDLRNAFALQVQRGDVTNRDAQAVDDWFPTADTFAPDNVWVFSFDISGHTYPSW